MQRIAIIDIGSNSARLVISHIYKNGAYNMVYNQKEALRLSQKVDEKKHAYRSSLQQHHRNHEKLCLYVQNLSG